MSGESLHKLPPRVVVGGGIGAGKSSVCDVFASRGFRVLSGDAIARSILREGSQGATTVGELWPEVLKDGGINRHRLADIVFSDPEALQTLESITHPGIRREILFRIEAESEKPFAVEIPVLGLLSDRPFYKVAVTAGVDLRRQRAVQRGGNEQDVRRRMASQPSESEWLAWADAVIDNSNSWADAESRVHALIDTLADDAF